MFLLLFLFSLIFIKPQHPIYYHYGIKNLLSFLVLQNFLYSIYTYYNHYKCMPNFYFLDQLIMLLYMGIYHFHLLYLNNCYNKNFKKYKIYMNYYYIFYILYILLYIIYKYLVPLFTDISTPNGWGLGAVKTIEFFIGS